MRDGEAAAGFARLASQVVVPHERSFDAQIGLRYDSPTAGWLEVGARHLGADGTVQSGVYAAVAEALASIGTAVEVVPRGLSPAGLSNATHVVREVRDGTLAGRATCRSEGELEWLWDVEIGPPGEPPAAIATVIVAVRPFRASS